MVLPLSILLMISLTDDGHCSRGLGGEKSDGRVLKFPWTSPNDLGVTVYDPLRGVPVAELKVIKNKEKLRHG
jgi:hypothetical protein